MTRRTTSLALSAAAILAFFAGLQVIAPPDGFFSGDQGAKYLQARAFALHGPLHPGIEVASRDIDPGFHHQILENRGGQLVGVFSWLLPMLTAPFLAAFGFRGLYVVPALSAVVIFLAAAALGRRLAGGTGLWTAWAVVLAAPVLVYGAELWEHAPAAACVIVAAVLFMDVAKSRRSRVAAEAGGSEVGLPAVARSAKVGGGRAEIGGRGSEAGTCQLTTGNRQPGTGNRQRPTGSWRVVLAGAVIAIGALFREEAGLALPALVVARAIAFPSDHRVKDAIRCGVLAAAGALAVFLLAVPVNLVVYGSPVPLHLSVEVGKTNVHPPVRSAIVAQLLLPDRWRAAFAISLVLAILAGLRYRARRGDAWFVLTIAGALATLAIVVLIPIWRVVVLGEPSLQAYSLDSIVHTWSFCVALLLLPLLGGEDVRWDVVRYLGVAAVLMTIGAVAIVPSAGGAQWSPRYLFAAAPLLAALASVPAMRISGPTPRRAALVLWTARVAIAAAAIAQVDGLRYLVVAKARNARSVHRLAELTDPDEVVISDVPWFPQVTAALIPSRRILLAWSPAEVPEIAAAAAQHGLRKIAVVSSTGETGYVAPGELTSAVPDCALTRLVRRSIGERGLIVHRYRCRVPEGMLK
jgi:hypothetical protein